MFCPKCGAQSPDGSAFCGNCGEIFAAQSQPINQGQPMGQPQYGGQPMGQPAQYGAQPAYGQPYGAPKVRTPLDPKKKQAIIIASVCGVILVTFLILLFTVIIPGSGVKGKLRHKWNLIEGGNSSDYLDLKSNTMVVSSRVYNITSWDFSGNALTITAASTTNPLDGETGRYVCAFSPDEKTLYLYEAELPTGGFTSSNNSISYRRVDVVFIRAD